MQPLDLDGQIVGVAFHCGMGASTNPVHVGRDASGLIVALLADLELLTQSEMASERAQPPAGSWPWVVSGDFIDRGRATPDQDTQLCMSG